MLISRRMVTAAMASVVAVNLVGCGGGGSDSSSDSGSTPLQLVISPANDTTGVSVLTTLKVVSNVSLDPTVVTGTNVRLVDENNKVIPVTVSYDDATRTVSVKPKLPLEHYVKYTVSVDGLKDMAGAFATPQQVSFYTTKNQRLSLELSGDPNHPNNKLCELAHIDPATKLIDKVTYSAADTSGNCAASEATLDPAHVLYVMKPSYSTQGRLWRWSQYSPADALVKYDENVFDTGNTQTRTDTYTINGSNNPVLTGYVSYEYDTIGRLARKVVTNDKGIAQEYRRYDYDALNRVVKEVVYKRSGTSVAWDPAVGDITDYQVYSYAPDNLSALVTTYKQYGVDNVVGNADDAGGADGKMTEGGDDVPYSYTKITYNTDGLMTHQDLFLSAGVYESTPVLDANRKYYYEDRQYGLEGNLMRARAYQKDSSSNFVLVTTQEFDTTY